MQIYQKTKLTNLSQYTLWIEFICLDTVHIICDLWVEIVSIHIVCVASVEEYLMPIQLACIYFNPFFNGNKTLPV